MRSFLKNRLDVFENEYQKLLWIALVSFCLFFVTALFRNFVDTTFLKRYGPDAIPMMLVINATLTILFFAFTDRLLKSYSDRIVLSFFLIASAALSPVFIYAISSGSRLVYPVIYQLMLLIDSVLFVHLWNMAGDMFDGRQGKRIFPLVTASQLSGTIAGSFSTGFLVAATGEAHILLIFGAVYMGVGVYMLGTGGKVLGQTEKLLRKAHLNQSTIRLHQTPALIKKYPIIRFLIVTGLIPNIVLPIFFYQFNTIANNSFPDEQSLIDFFSVFRGFTTLTTFVTLLFSSRFLSWFGLPNASLFFPINFTVLFGILPHFFNIFVAGYGQFSSILIQRAVAGPVNKILYSIIPNDLQTWGRTFIRGSVLKIGMFTGAIFMLVSKPYFDARDMSYLGLVLSLILLVETFQFRSVYKDVLKQVLTHQGSYLGDSGAESAINFGLFSSKDGLNHADREIRPEAGIEQPISIQNTDEALERLTDESALARIDAASYFTKHHDFRAVRNLVLMLSDDDDRIRSAAVDALRRYPKQVAPYLEASLLTADFKGKQGILEVIRLSYSITSFENSSLLNRAVTEVYTNLIYIHCLEAINHTVNTRMLVRYLKETNEDILRLVFYGLWVYHSDMRLMYDAIKSDKAAIAVELLENTVRRDVARYLIPLLEDIPVERKIEAGRSMLLLIREVTVSRVLTLLAQSEDPLMRLLAVRSIGDVWPDESLVPVLESHLDGDCHVSGAAKMILFPSLSKDPPMINTSEIIDRFAFFPIFEGMSIRELHALATVTEIRNFEVNEIILQEGAENFSIYLITSGRVSVYRNYGHANQILKFSIGAGSFLGFVGMFTNMPVQVTCVAVEPTQTYILPQRQFQAIIRIYPQIAINMCKFCALKFKEFFDI